MTEQPQHTGASAPAQPRRVLAIVIAFAVISTGTWLYKRPPPAEAPLPSPQAQASQAASGVAPAEPPAQAASTAASAAPVQAAAARASASAPDYSAMAKKAMEQANSPAEALRKVQVALGGGTPKEVLEAAQMLQMCSMMAGAPGALYAMRDGANGVPEPLKKMMDAGGGVNKVIESAEGQARRCQVFDQATLGRSKELFQRAYEGGAEGGASAYLNALQNPLEKEKADPALIAKLQAEVRKAAAGGDADALLHLAMATGDSARDLGVTPVQRAGYKVAWKTIQDEKFPGIGMGDIMEKAMATAFDQAKSTKPLSAAEQAEAAALAQQVVDAWRRKRKGG